MIDITDIGPRYLQVYDNYDQFSDASSDYVKGEDHVCYVVTENEVIYWIALENVWRPLNVVTTSAGNIEGIDNPVNVTLRTVDGGMIYNRVPNIPDAERVISMDNFLVNYPQIEYLDFTGNVNTTSMKSAFANSQIKDIGNINFNNVTNINQLFAGCNNFDENYSVTINSNVSQFECTNCVLNSNLPELTIEIPNVNKGSLNINYLNGTLNTNLNINYNNTFTYDLNETSHSFNANEQFGFLATTSVCDNEVKCPLFVTGVQELLGGTSKILFGLPKKLECELFLSAIDDSRTSTFPNCENEQFQIKAKHVFFDYASTSVHRNATKLSKHYDIIFDNDILQDIKITTKFELADVNVYWDICGIRIDLNKINLSANSSEDSVLQHGLVYGKGQITIDTINSFPSYSMYGFPYFKDLELTQLQDSNIDNTTANKTIYAVFNNQILPYNKEIEDKTKLGTHVFKDIDLLMVELHNIPNLTIESSESKHTILLESDYNNAISIIPTNQFSMKGSFDLNTSYTNYDSNVRRLFLGSGISFNDVTFNLVDANPSIYVCCVGDEELYENNTVFDEKYDYKFSYAHNTTSSNHTYFYLQGQIYGPQVSIDKVAKDNIIYGTSVCFPNKSCNDTFLYAKYNENLQINLDTNNVYQSNYWRMNWLDFYYKYFNNQSNPLIIDSEVSFNYKNTMYSEDSDVIDAIIEISSGHYTQDDFTKKTLTNQKEYNQYITSTVNMYVDCTENGSIPFNIYGWSMPDRYYDFYVGYCRRINNLENIYGNVTLECKIHNGDQDYYNQDNMFFLLSLNRDSSDAIISHSQGNKPNSKSKLKHIDVNRALKGYWDIRFLPDLDQATVKAIVNNLEEWDGEYKQDFNLYRSQWDYLSAQEQTLLNTKNYNVRITENHVDTEPEKKYFT